VCARACTCVLCVRGQAFELGAKKTMGQDQTAKFKDWRASIIVSVAFPTYHLFTGLKQSMYRDGTNIVCLTCVSFLRGCSEPLHTQHGTFCLALSGSGAEGSRHPLEYRAKLGTCFSDAAFNAVVFSTACFFSALGPWRPFPFIDLGSEVSSLPA